MPIKTFDWQMRALFECLNLTETAKYLHWTPKSFEYTGASNDRSFLSSLRIGNKTELFYFPTSGLNTRRRFVETGSTLKTQLILHFSHSHFLSPRCRSGRVSESGVSDFS